MKNTLMFLLASLLLAFSLTACGGGGQQTGANGDSGAAGQTGGLAGDAAGYNGAGSTANGNGTAGLNGSDANGNGTAGGGSGAYKIDRDRSGAIPDGSLVDDARDVLDGAGNAVGRAANDF